MKPIKFMLISSLLLLTGCTTSTSTFDITNYNVSNLSYSTYYGVRDTAVADTESNIPYLVSHTVTYENTATTEDVLVYKYDEVEPTYDQTTYKPEVEPDYKAHYIHLSEIVSNLETDVDYVSNTSLSSDVYVPIIDGIELGVYTKTFTANYIDVVDLFNSPTLLGATHLGDDFTLISESLLDDVLVDVVLIYMGSDTTLDNYQDQYKLVGDDKVFIGYVLNIDTVGLYFDTDISNSTLIDDETVSVETTKTLLMQQAFILEFER